MKKMLLSLILVISMFAFAAESSPSATVGYVKYPLVMGTTRANNFIALPFAGYTTAQQLDPAATHIWQVSEWIPTGAQGWNTIAWDSDFGEWTGDFAVGRGKALMVNTYAAYNFIVSGTLQTDPTYNLVLGTTRGNNAVMHPLGLNALTTAQGIAGDIGANCFQLSEWIPTGAQGWNTIAWDSDFGEWSGDFNSSIGKALMVNVTANTNWVPGAKDGDGIIVEPTENTSSPKGVARIVGISVRNASGVKYDFSAAPYGGVTWIAQLKRGATLYPTKLTHNSIGSAWYNTATHSVCRINIGNFTDADWAMGDSIRWEIRDDLAVKAANGLTITLPINDNNATNITYGVTAGYVLGGPWSITAPSSIEDSTMPLETKLHQNYPNPFNPTTTIKFDLKQAGNVQLNVYNYNGQLVKALVNGEMKAGFQRVDFDASSLAAGVYYYTMQTAGKTMTHKMVLIK